MPISPSSLPDRIPTPPLGAREITTFDGRAANDNGDSGVQVRARQPAGFGLPAMAFFSGLGAAAVVALAGQMLGIG
jgi:hypothetical protein